MKAGIYYGPGRVGVEHLPKPSPKASDVVVKVISSGICGADILAYRISGTMSGIFRKGENGSDGQFGHEIAGIVEVVSGITAENVWFACI